MSPAATGLTSLFGLDPGGYRPHLLHREDRTYRETNCYLDVLVELLHGRGDEPLAALGSSVRVDFEGDQWTFFKPSSADLELLFGVDVHEMQPYRSLPDQIDEQIAAGRTLIVEVDSWYLPDTASTSYRTAHVKSSIAAEAIDVQGERLRYFHNTGLHELAGEDYRGAFRSGRPFADDVLPPYTELVRFDAGARLEGEALRAAARDLLGHHLRRRPATNPFPRFGEHLAEHLPELLQGDAGDYHDYAFATVRMVGSSFEVCASHVDWLLAGEGARAAAAMREIVEASKTLSFKLARRRPFDAAPAIGRLGAAWERALDGLDAIVG